MSIILMVRMALSLRAITIDGYSPVLKNDDNECVVEDAKHHERGNSIACVKCVVNDMHASPIVAIEKA